MILATFHSVSSALYLEEVLRSRGVACKVIPVPRELSSSCGYAAEIDAGDPEELRSLMDSQAIEWEALYGREDGGYRELAVYE